MTRARRCVIRGRALAGADRERGSIAPAIPVIALVLLLLGGLVIDASRQLNARGEAVAFAEEAARAGVQSVQQNPKGEIELIADQVPQKVADYCAQIATLPQVDSCRLVRIERSHEGTNRPFTVVTRVELSVPASLLGIVGVDTLSASGDGRAEPREGVLDPVDPTGPEIP